MRMNIFKERSGSISERENSSFSRRSNSLKREISERRKVIIFLKNRRNRRVWRNS
jgi:hypothetical protein